MVQITTHACERYAERVLGQTMPQAPDRYRARIEQIRCEMAALIGDRVRPGHREQYHLPVGKAVLVVRDGAVVTVKLPAPPFGCGRRVVGR